MSLNTAPRLNDTDYARIVAAHKDLSPEDSAALNARLILILANHIGDSPTLEAAIDLAVKTGSTAG